MQFLLPPPCQKGDRVAILSPAGPIQQQHLEAGCQLLVSWGLHPSWEPSILQQWGYLAGTDTQRFDTFLRAWTDPTIKAILCARGGYGYIRFLEHLPFDIIRHQPKRFFGFSDITILLNTIA
ncbi:MAG: LD-carboxypeptidase, partial [Myxococcota bacterium]